MRLPFYLTRLSGAEPDPSSLTINDIFDGDNKEYVCIFNYMLDPEWLFSECPALLTIPVLICHGQKSLESVLIENVVSSRVDLGAETYGSHHTKMMIIFYSNGIRIAIGTANLVEGDWSTKTQGFYVQDFPLLSHNSDHTTTTTTTTTTNNTYNNDYMNDLSDYLKEIKLYSSFTQKVLTDKVINRLPLYDYSSAYAILMPSVPGRHKVYNTPYSTSTSATTTSNTNSTQSSTRIGINKWGHFKLKSALDYYYNHLNTHPTTTTSSSSTSSTTPSSSSSDINILNTEILENHTFIQCSSLGSLTKNEAYITELTSSMKATKEKLKFIWPTVETVRNSLEGYNAGTSIPCDSKNMYEDYPANKRLKPFFRDNM